MKQSNGFTLVELAIALMVIGLLIGGVLKGQELIENARVTATIRQLKAYDAATMIFRNTYNALPGDIKRPNRIPNCTDDICAIPGNGNGKIGYSDTPQSGIEQFNFFPHLTKAGMIQGPEGGTTEQYESGNLEDLEWFFPVPAFGADKIVIQWLDSWNNGYQMAKAGHHFYLDKSSGKGGLALDVKMDDGHPRTGDVYVDDPYGCVKSDNEEEWDPSLSGECSFYVMSGF